MEERPEVDLMALDFVVAQLQLLQSPSMQGDQSQDKKIEHLLHLYALCRNPLEIKYVVRQLQTSAGLRIGLSTKSIENILIEHFQAAPEQISRLENQVFGYRLDQTQNLSISSKQHKSLASPKPTQLTYNIPYKAMVGRAVKEPEEVVLHFQKL